MMERHMVHLLDMKIHWRFKKEHKIAQGWVKLMVLWLDAIK